MKNLIKLSVLMLIIWFVFVPCVRGEVSSEDFNKIFDKANDLFENGDYAASIKEYNKILDSGYESANVYFNVGNAYFRNGEPAMAHVNYLRAKRLDPYDADIAANDKFVLSEMGTPVMARKPVFRLSWLDRYYRDLSSDMMAMASSALFGVSLVIILYATIRRKKMKRYVIAFIIVNLIAAANLAIGIKKSDEVGHQAVVLESGVDSLYGPFDTATVFFRLHKGTAVWVLNEKPEWYKIRRADGKVGWVKKDKIAIV